MASMTDVIDKTTLFSVFFEWEVMNLCISNYMGTSSALESVYSLCMTGFIQSYC